jgi:hypothetical protein
MIESKIVAAIENWEKVAERHRKVGASDTEPHSLFQWTLYHAVNNLLYIMPSTPDHWQLYDLPNAAQAAAELTKALADCIEIINADPKESLPYLKKYCWRVECKQAKKPKLELVNLRIRKLEKMITELESKLKQSKVNND